MATLHHTPQPSEKSAKTDHSASRSDIPTAGQLAEWRNLDPSEYLCLQSVSFMLYWDTNAKTATIGAEVTQSLNLSWKGLEACNRSFTEHRRVYLDNLHKGHKHAILAVAESERLSV